MSDTEKNRQSLVAYLAEAGSIEALDRFCHEDIELPRDIPNWEGGLTALKAYYATQNGLDMRITVLSTLAEADYVVARVEIEGRQSADYMGIPCRQKSFKIEEIILTQWREDKIALVQRVADRLSLIQQLAL
ncbi:ester cyclase [Sphingosinicella soli]|uniref:Putative ester cyclase n=1 Tax=Sphingosinicella soli TaxID=333708 RepID=A0A7W7F7G1_9SPHN|nr:ester cyclase [Sphingosinicella soli]MBB4633396.1 putative ester cyclase [Sphingosinicella soli]